MACWQKAERTRMVQPTASDMYSHRGENHYWYPNHHVRMQTGMERCNFGSVGRTVGRKQKLPLDTSTIPDSVQQIKFGIETKFLHHPSHDWTWCICWLPVQAQKENIRQVSAEMRRRHPATCFNTVWSTGTADPLFGQRHQSSMLNIWKKL